MKSIFLFEFKGISFNKPLAEENYPSLNTDFGKTLFMNELTTETTRKIKVYIDYLNYHRRLNEIEEYNSLVFNIQQAEIETFTSPLIEDEELEYINLQKGLSLALSENSYFSMFKDMNIEDIRNITKDQFFQDKLY